MTPVTEKNMLHFAGDGNDTGNRIGYYVMLVMVAKLGTGQGVTW
jgi:hypothetical protein